MLLVSKKKNLGDELGAGNTRRKETRKTVAENCQQTVSHSKLQGKMCIAVKKASITKNGKGRYFQQRYLNITIFKIAEFSSEMLNTLCVLFRRDECTLDHGYSDDKESTEPLSDMWLKECSVLSLQKWRLPGKMTTQKSDGKWHFGERDTT